MDLFDYIWRGQSGTSNSFVTLITLGFSLGVGCSFLVILSVSFEKLFLSKVVKLANKAFQTGSLKPTGAIEDIERFKAVTFDIVIQGIPSLFRVFLRRSSIWRLFDLMADLRARESQPPIDPLISRRYFEGGGLSRLSRLLPSVLISLGLMGTIYGLAGSVGSMPVLFAESSVKSLEDIVEWTNLSRQAMAGVISGLRVAFSTTIAGLLAATALTVVNFFTTWHGTSFFRRLELFSVSALMPMIFPDKLNFASSISDALRHSTAALGKTTERISATYATLETELTILCDYARNNKTTTANLLENNERLEDMYIELQKSLTSMENMIGGFNRYTENVMTRLEHEQETTRTLLVTTFTKMEDRFNIILNQNKDDQSNLLQNLKSHNPTSEQFRVMLDTLEQAKESSAELSESNRDMRTSIDNQIEYMESLKKWSDSQTKVNERLEGLWEGMKPEDLKNTALLLNEIRSELGAIGGYLGRYTDAKINEQSISKWFRSRFRKLDR